jgi:hypothetical protein
MWGHPDFFDNSHKRKMFKLAEIKPSDAFMILVAVMPVFSFLLQKNLI